MSDAGWPSMGRYVEPPMMLHPGYPCRISLTDSRPGDELILLNYEHLPVDSPYRMRFAIFIRRGRNLQQSRRGSRAAAGPRVWPCRRLRRARHDDGLRGSSMGANSSRRSSALLRPSDAEYLHVHFAAPGCYAARVERTPAGKRRNRSDRQGVRPLGRVRRGLQLPASSPRPHADAQASKDCPAPIKAMPIVTRHDHGSGEASKAPKSWQAAPARAVACREPRSIPPGQAQDDNEMLPKRCSAANAVAKWLDVPVVSRWATSYRGLSVSPMTGRAWGLDGPMVRRASAADRQQDAMSAGGLSLRSPAPASCEIAPDKHCATHTFSARASGGRPSQACAVALKSGPAR